MSCSSRDETQFDCYGPLILTPSTSSNEGKSYLTCSSTEVNYDCVCSPTRDFNVPTCAPGQTDINGCVVIASNVVNQCTITWKGDYTSYVDVLPLSCERVLVSPSCKTKCKWTNDNTLQCREPIVCSALPGQIGNSPSNVCSKTSSVVVTTKTKTIAPATISTTTDDTGPGTTVLALGVVAGLTFIALVIALVMMFFVFRRRNKRSSQTNDDYTDMNVGEVNNTAYESSVGIPNQYEHLEKDHLKGNDPKSGLYMDLDDTTTAQTNQSSQQNGTIDSIYNSIDEYEEQGRVTSANYFVVEKQQEEESPQKLTEDLSPTDISVVEAYKTDTNLTLKARTNSQSKENIPTDNYFMLEKEENEINTKEGTPNNDPYNTLNSGISIETTKEGFTRVRSVINSQENSINNTTTEESVEDYDKLFQKPNNVIMYDADNDYDHMDNDDSLTSL